MWKTHNTFANVYIWTLWINYRCSVSPLESDKLRATRTLVSYVLSCFMCFVTYVFSSRVLRASCPTFSRASRASCLTCSRAWRASCPTCSRDFYVPRSRASPVLCSLVPHVFSALRFLVLLVSRAFVTWTIWVFYSLGLG